MSDHTWSSSEVCELAGISYRQLDYWCRTCLIPGQPGGARTGSGKRRRFTADQVDRVRRIALASKLRGATLDEAVAMLEGATVFIRQPVVPRVVSELAPFSLDEAQAHIDSLRPR